MSHVRIKYVRDMKKNPVGCIAYMVKDDQISIGVASCNPADTFKKEISRSLAIGRLVDAPQSGVAPVERSVKALTKAVLNMATNSEHASSRVVRMAHREVKSTAS
jgi:hypothetical protein